MKKRELLRFIKIENEDGRIFIIPKSQAFKEFGIKKDGVNKAIRTGDIYKGWFITLYKLDT